MGPYRLVREIGRGGMSSVWLAERPDGIVKRDVALKMPLRTLDSPAQIERFERERDVLAMLAHPQIARLYDAGVTPAGQPFIVLEPVDGLPITAACDARQLGVASRLQVFMQALAAVGHAHKHLVVHRDIKPSNVFVDAHGQVKLLDFGIAKLLVDPLLLDPLAGTGPSPLTRDAGCALTPGYAAPEQMDGRPISTATDVYALGVLLYELLTGRLPNAGAQASVAQALAAALHVVPEPPSLAGFDAATAQRRSLPDAARLQALLDGDLDTIVLKALRKNPAERYGSVEAFADDLTRYLEHRPITARAPSFLHRTRLFMRRHRRVGAVAALGLLGVIGFAGTAVYVADFDNPTIRKITPDGVVSTVAGNGSAGGTDADGPAARFNGPFGVACDAGGGDTALYVADAFNHAVRKITPSGRVSTLVGTGSAGASDGFASSAASFAEPFGIAVSGGSSASVYVTDTFSSTLRRIGPDGAVTTLAQAGRDGNLDAGSDADSADSWSPRGVAVARDGAVFVADASWHVIRKISADGVVSTLAGSRSPGADDGTGTAASFSSPHGLAIDRQGTLYLSDRGNHLIRKITPAGVVTTLAGTGTRGSADGPAASASFDTPQAIALDGLGNLYVYDAGSYNLRKISAAGIVTTLAGSGEPGYADGKGVAAAFDVIGGIAADQDGTLYVGDTFNHLVRKVTPDGTVSTLAGQAKQTGSVNGALAPARFFGPAGVAIGAGGSLFVADTFNHTVRRIE